MSLPIYQHSLIKCSSLLFISLFFLFLTPLQANEITLPNIHFMNIGKGGNNSKLSLSHIDGTDNYQLVSNSKSMIVTRNGSVINSEDYLLEKFPVDNFVNSIDKDVKLVEWSENFLGATGDYSIFVGKTESEWEKNYRFAAIKRDYSKGYFLGKKEVKRILKTAWSYGIPDHKFKIFKHNSPPKKNEKLIRVSGDTVTTVGLYTKKYLTSSYSKIRVGTTDFYVSSIEWNDDDEIDYQQDLTSSDLYGEKNLKSDYIRINMHNSIDGSDGYVIELTNENYGSILLLTLDEFKNQFGISDYEFSGNHNRANGLFFEKTKNGRGYAKKLSGLGFGNYFDFIDKQELFVATKYTQKQIWPKKGYSNCFSVHDQFFGKIHYFNTPHQKNEKSKASYVFIVSCLTHESSPYNTSKVIAGYIEENGNYFKREIIANKKYDDHHDVWSIHHDDISIIEEGGNFTLSIPIKTKNPSKEMAVFFNTDNLISWINSNN